MDKPYQVKDGKKFRTGLRYREICCGCSLVHDVEITVIDDTTLEHEVRVNDRATTSARRKNKKQGKPNENNNTSKADKR